MPVQPADPTKASKVGAAGVRAAVRTRVFIRVSLPVGFAAEDSVGGGEFAVCEGAVPAVGRRGRGGLRVSEGVFCGARAAVGGGGGGGGEGGGGGVGGVVRLRAGGVVGFPGCLGGEGVASVGRSVGVGGVHVGGNCRPGFMGCHGCSGGE